MSPVLPAAPDQSSCRDDACAHCLIGGFASRCGCAPPALITLGRSGFSAGMLSVKALEDGFAQILADLESLTPLQLLQRYQLLPAVVRQLAQQQAIIAVQQFPAEEEASIISQLFKGASIAPPAHLDSKGQWLADLPAELRGSMQKRFDQVCWNYWLEQNYANEVEALFLERRAGLERLVYRVLRLRDQGVAEELYLCLLEGESSFAELATRFSKGDERFWGGLTGPVAVGQIDPRLRERLLRLGSGQIAPPLRLDCWVLILQMEQRLPASLTPAVRQQLLQELFERDLQQAVQEITPLQASWIPSDG